MLRLKFKMAVLLLLLFSCSAHAEQTWIYFILQERPYYDRNNKPLASIEGMKNRPGIDEFHGGGLYYPDISKVTVTKEHEKGTAYLILVDGPIGDLDVQSGAIISEAEAETIKPSIFGVYPEVESGVSAPP